MITIYLPVFKIRIWWPKFRTFNDSIQQRNTTWLFSEGQLDVTVLSWDDVGFGKTKFLAILDYLKRGLK